MKPPDSMLQLTLLLTLINILMPKVEGVLYRDYTRISRGYLKPVRMRKRAEPAVLFEDRDQEREEDTMENDVDGQGEDLYREQEKRSTLAWANDVLRNFRREAKLKADLVRIHALLLQIKELRRLLEQCPNCYEEESNVNKLPDQQLRLPLQ